MLRRSTRIQLILFVILTLVGVSYVSAEYVGLTKGLFGSNACTIAADFPDSGGIFTNAEVTYRGVTVGRVGEIHIIPQGVRVDLSIDDCASPRIPTATDAVVADRSVVGEQYVNLIPRTSSAPYISGSSYVLPMNHNSIPIASETLLENLNSLVTSLPLKDLKTTVSELYLAFDQRGQDLGNLIDASNALLQSASEPNNLDNTIALIENSQTVLGTQLDVRDEFYSWAHSLNLLSQQLKKSNPDIEHLLDTGPSDLSTIQNLITDNRTALGVTLANLSTTGQVLVQHLDGVEQILELYPALAAGGKSVLDKPNEAKLGLVLQSTPMPQDCGDPTDGGQGYSGTTRRSPNNLSPIAPNVNARCTAAASTGTNIRGSSNVPGGDPISTAGGGYAYPDTTTNNVAGTSNVAGTGTTYSTSLMQGSTLGDASWLALLTDGLH